MYRNITIFALLFVSGLALRISAQTHAVIVVEAVSPQELHDWGWMSPPSSGLTTVGKGELVYLSGHESAENAITSFTWSFAAVPNGSALTDLDEVSAAWTTFRPDTTGQFVVQLSISTANGSSDTTVTITSATYVGVGTIGGAMPKAPQCGVCHGPNGFLEDKVTRWEGTKHASKVTREIDGLGSVSYNETCLKCHTVGYDTLAANDGFDDIQAAFGWTFPDTLQVGNWENMVNNFNVVAQKANVQCENCHGAGSQHLGDETKIDVSLDEGICGKCHEEEPDYIKNIQWKNSKHSEGVGVADRTPCNKCHSGWGFIDRLDMVPENEWRLGFQQISCAVCHDPHSAANEHQIRSLSPVTLPNGVVVEGGKGTLCMNCHQSRNIINNEFVSAEVYVANYLSNIRPSRPRSFGPHHGPQTDMLAATNVITFGQKLPTSPHLQEAPDACVTCHMAEPVPGAENFVGEHTWSMDSDSLEVDNIKACEPCHGNIGTSFEDKKYYDDFSNADHDGNGIEEGLILEVRGLLDTLEAVLLDDTTKFVLNDEGDLRMRDSSVTLIEASAVYNHNFILEDKSMGIHNPAFAVALLQTSIQAVRGEVSSTSTEIAVLPDQYSLSQNYPNPFNPTTKIEFKIVKYGPVTLRVFDLLGRLVATLIDGKMSAGSHIVAFDGNNLSSGVYFYNLTAGNFSQNRKMILMK